MNGKKSKVLVYFLIFLLTALVSGAVIFCLRFTRSHYEGASVSTEFDLIDSDIRLGNLSHAVSALKKLEKRSLGLYERIGIYKRFDNLGEKKLAEKCLLKTLRHYPKNLEVVALYGNLLLRQNKVSEALSKTKVLSGTEYSSIYAEAFLKNARTLCYDADELFREKKGLSKSFKKKSVAKQDDKFEYDLFTDKRFIPIYIDASNSSVSSWLINASSLLMYSGNYSEASDLYNRYKDNFDISFKDSLFWGIVFYDSGKYAESLTALQKSDKLDASIDIVSAIEIKALESDNYYILDDDKTAQSMRREILDVYSPYMQAFMADNVPSLKRILPLLFMNTALYARNTGDLLEQYNKLYELVSYYPLYEPGLAAYAEYAIESKKRPEEENLDKKLRSVGLKTVAMEQRDSIPVVEFEDVIERIDSAMETKKTPGLTVIKEIVNNESIFRENRDVKASKVWKLLESNEISASVYPSEIMHYSVIHLISNGDLQNAQRLFWNYMNALYPDDDLEKMDLWECETAAYFASERQEYNLSRKYYEHILNKYSKRIPVTNTAGQNDSLTYSYINLANIFAGYNKVPQAIDMLNKASARITENKLKAEVLYRIAEECLSMGNEKDALRSLQYSVSLNPEHSKARLLLKRMNKK